MRILIDMNLSPNWGPLLCSAGHHAEHWSEIGSACPTDLEIMEWARANGAVVLTHDLDFSAILSATRAGGPSVLQVRARDVTAVTMGPIVLSSLAQFEHELDHGAVVVVEPARAKARILPLT